MKIKIQQIYFYIFSCLYTLLFLFLLFEVDWFKFSFLRTESDIFNYNNILTSGGYELNTTSLSWEMIFNEPLWALIISNISNYFSNENSIYIFSVLLPTIISILYILFIYKNTRMYYSIFMLLNPLATMFYLNQLRLAFSVSILYIVLDILYDKKNNVLHIYKLLFFTAPLILIHTSSIIYILLILSYYFISTRLLSKSFIIIHIILVFIGFLLSYMTSSLLSDILTIIGDERRASVYATTQWQTSFLTSIYCFFLYINIALSSKSKIKNGCINYLSCYDYISIIILLMVLFSPLFTGGYPLRFLSAIIPVLILCILEQKFIYKILSIVYWLIISLYIGFSTLNWSYFFI
ncbi:EpsG family protein [Simonsiella muelleri]|nr:EpsG family protein [Simonsiella muelleri]